MKRKGGRAGYLDEGGRTDAWEVAVKLLAMRGLTTAELSRRLARRGCDADQIAAVMARLTASGYLDDAEYAKTWARDRARRHAVAPARLARELRARGLGAPEVALAVREAFAERDAGELAEAAAAGKLKQLQGVSPGVGRRRLAGYLTRRGFAVEIVLAVCRKHFPGMDGPDDQ